MQDDDRYTLSEAADDVARCWLVTTIIEGVFNVLAAVFSAGDN